MSLPDFQNYQLLSSTRYDLQLKEYNWNNDDEGPSPFFLLPFQLDRVVAAAKDHGWTTVQSTLKYSDFKSACLAAVRQKQSGDESGAYRIRITVSKDGQISVTATPLPASFTSDPTSASALDPNVTSSSNPPAEAVVQVYIDNQPMKPSIFTITKTTVREAYDEAKTRNQSALSTVPQHLNSDVLLYNTEGEIMETTIFNVAFRRNGLWITPLASSGCLPGVVRRWLLENGRIHEDTNSSLAKDSIHKDEWVLLFNGVQGCRLGKICG